MVLAIQYGHKNIAILLSDDVKRWVTLDPDQDIKVVPSAHDRRAAILNLLAEDTSLRIRLGIKADLEFAPEFDVERLVRFAASTREASDPALGTDVEVGIAFHLQAAKMLDGEVRHGYGN